MHRKCHLQHHLYSTSFWNIWPYLCKLTPYMIIMPTVIHTYYEGFTLTKQEECRLFDSCLLNDILKKKQHSTVITIYGNICLLAV